MKYFKKITAFIMSLSYAAAGISGTVYSEGYGGIPFSADLSKNIVYSTDNETIYNISINSIDKNVDTLVIPSEYVGKKTGGLISLEHNSIKNIVFPVSFTTIKSLDCKNLECIVMPDDITDAETPPVGKNVTIIGSKNSFASYYASSYGNPFRQSGDVNNDGKLSMTDVISMISYLTGRTNADDITILSADLDHDGRMSITDIVQMNNLIIKSNDCTGISGCLAEPDMFGFERSANSEPDSSLGRFAADVSSAILRDTRDHNGEVNTVYSPLSLYMAMSVLAECADTETLDELLDFLHADNKDDLRKINEDLFKSMYLNKYSRYSKIANSIWLDEGENFNQETIDRLADYYFTSVYEKDLQLQEDLDEISEWISNNTSGKLKPEFTPLSDDSAKIINAVSFKESWKNGFKSENEKEFTLPDGTSKNCLMMTGTDIHGLITDNDKYTRYSKSFNDGYRMNFVLPAEGLTTDDILSDSELLNDMFSKNQNERSTSVAASIPSYDVSSKFDLTNTIKDLGIEHIFKGADFTPLSENGNLYVSDIVHEAVLAINNDGCEAAAYTATIPKGVSSSDYIPEEFTADRPFIYYISDSVNTPLFIGVINDPEKQ